MDGFENIEHCVVPLTDSEQELLDLAEAQVKALELERTVSPGETNKQLTRRLIKEAGPAAAQSIIHLSKHAKNESVRLNAAAAVLDRNLGKVANEQWVAEHDEDEKRDPWTGILADSIKNEDSAIERARNA